MALFAFRHLPADAHTPPNVQAMMPGLMVFMAVMGLVFVGLYGWILVKLLSLTIREEFMPTSQES